MGGREAARGVGGREAGRWEGGWLVGGRVGGGGVVPRFLFRGPDAPPPLSKAVNYKYFFAHIYTSF